MSDADEWEQWLSEAARTGVLDLPGRELREVPEAVRRLTGLRSLDLSGNGLAVLPEWIGELAGLTALNLGGNRLSALPDSIGELAGLTALNLGGNRLSALPDSIGDLAALEGLDLTGNDLSVLPASIGGLTRLTVLDLTQNGLSALPDSIGELAGLVALYLGGNRLSALPDSIGDLTGLETLYLGGNGLRVVPESIGNLARLTNLDLTGNGLSALPESIGRLTGLAGLYLGGNGLSALPESIGSLTALETLNLEQNEFTVLPESIGNLTGLVNLDLEQNALSELPDWIGGLTWLESLYLRGNGLSALPESIGNLAELETLYLGGNDVSALPDSIGDLTRLLNLDLTGNGLSALPDSIGDLAALVGLYLSGNRLSALPESIGDLTVLETLNLEQNPLSALPGSICGLAALTTLDLRGTRLSALPESLGELTRLETLYLGGVGLSALPASLGELTGLQNLDLGDSGLSALPEWISGLTGLVSLYLSRNGLSALPEWVGGLTGLATLDLTANQLTALPESIGGLTALTGLYLTGNALSSLPESIGGLAALTGLYLGGNSLTVLPESIGNLTGLENLDLEGNPLTSPPPEVVAAGAEAVLAFMAGLAADSVRQWASKVLLVGQGRAGKTSLLRALQGEAFDPQEESTHGLRVSCLDVPHPDPAQGGVMMNLTAWDFGGQEIYHATHQFFLSERSLFLLLWDAQVGWQESRLYYWLDMIKARAPQAPVILVATHIGPRPPDFPMGELQRAFPQVIVESLEVDSSTGQGVGKVREAIGRVAATLPLMGTRWPRTWLEAADAIRTLPDNHVAVERLREIMADHGVIHPAHQEGLATALHSLGDILYYPQEDELGDLVVLRPQWLTGYLSRVLDDPKSAVRGGGGLFTRTHQRALWPELDPGMRQHFLAMMERFDLSYRTSDPAASLVVELLPWDSADYQQQWEAARSTHRELRLRYRLHTVPPGIPTWFIAREQRFSTGLHWRTGALLRHPDGVHTALLTMDQHAKTAELAVRGPYPQDFFAVLKDGFQQTLDRYPGLGVDYLVPCAGVDGADCAHEFRLEQLQARISLDPPRETIECPVGMNDVNVRRLLEGIEPPTLARSAELNEALAAVTRQQTQLLQQEQQQTTLLGDLQQMTADLARVTAIQTSAIAEQQRAFLAAQRRDQNWHQVLCPTVMAMEHVRHRPLGGSVVRLHLYCEAPGAWHRAPGSEPYEVKLTSERLQAVVPFAAAVLGVLKYAVPVAGAAIGMASEDLAKQLTSDIEMTKALVEALSGNLPDKGTDVGQVHTMVRAVEDPQFRAMQQLLVTLDPQRRWGGLSKVATPEGDVLWLCSVHARQYRGLPGEPPALTT